MTTHDLDKLLATFSSTRHLDELTRASDALLKGKLVNKARSDHRFEHGLSNCIAVLASDRPDAERLKALANAYRLGAASKPVMRMVRELARPHLARALPPLDSLPDGEDRYYASLSIFDAEGEWVIEFAARGIAREETAETARANLAHRLVTALPVSDCLSHIATELAELKFETEKPAESGARRLRRVISAIRPGLVAVPIPPGTDLGRALRTFFLSPFSTARPRGDSSLTHQLAEDCCGLVYDILRTQITIVADSAIYRSLLPVREWIEPAMWPRFVRDNEVASRVLDGLESAIVLLAKQNVTDQELLGTLQLFTESRDAAARRAAELAKRNPGLDEGVRDWLSRFGRVRTTPVLSSMEDARETSSDPAIAALLVTANSLRRAMREGSRLVEAPNESSSLKGEPVINQLITDIESLASSRGLTLRLEPGEIVDYSQSAHELAGGHEFGVRKVRVLKPLVERNSSNGVVTVVRKAVVDPMGGGDE